MIPRPGTQEQIRWFEFTPGYVLHMVNAWEDGDWIVMDGCFQPDPTIRRDRSEAPFAKSTGGADEDTGYVVTLATNVMDYGSEVWIFDAKRITAGPIARVCLAARVAAGFHAYWIPGRELWGGLPRF